MTKNKSPYIEYTVDEVRKMENNYFCLQLGGDFIVEDEYYIFTKAEVSKLYTHTLKRLINLIEDGSEKDRLYAIDLIGGLSIKQMRLH